jgi:hypothetical protein
MPDSKTIIDIATLNANYANLKETISNVLGEVRAGNQQNAEIIKTLGGLDKQEEFNATYRDKCDRDRMEIRNEVNQKLDTHDARITANTNSISRMNGKTAGISLAISTIIAIAAILVQYHH